MPGRATVAMMDLAGSGALATVCSFADGTTSLYLSTGGGVIGVGSDDRANAASRAFIAAVEAAMDRLEVTDGAAHLEEGSVRFLLRIDNTVYGAAALVVEVSEPDHQLHDLWVGGQQVLTWIRIISEQQQQG